MRSTLEPGFLDHRIVKDKLLKNKRHYQRTTALLGAQPRAARPVSRRRITLPRVSWRVTWPLILLLALLLWLLGDARWYVAAENIQVQGTSSLMLAADVTRAADLLGWHGFLLRPQATGDLILEAVPGVVAATATCQRFPAACVLEVEERVPHLIWQTETTTYWADQHGTLFPAQDKRDNLLRVRGPLLDKNTTVLPATIVAGIEALVALEVPMAVVDYHPRRGLIWTDEEGRQIAFGSGPDMAARWQMYQALIVHLDAQGIFPTSVDVRFPSGPTYSLDRSW